MKKYVALLLALVMALCVSSVALAEESIPANVVVKTIGDVTLYSFQSNSVSPVIIEGESLVLIDYPGDSEEQATAYKAFVESLAKPIDRMIISHIDQAHWIHVEEYFPDVPLYSVDADEIMAAEAGAALTVSPLADDAALSIDGVAYEFVTNREIGAWEIKLPGLKAVYVEHLGYVNLHVLLAPLAPRLEMLQSLSDEGYIWFMPGHGAPMANPEFVNLVAAYYGDVLAAVENNADVEAAVAEITEKYPQYNTRGMLENMLPGLYNQ